MNEPFIHSNHESEFPSRRRGPRRDPAKLAAIAAAARHVLSAQGLRLTQVADVARTAGVSAGTVYVYVSEKEALIELALLSAARFELPSVARPVTYSARRLARVAERAMTERLQWPLLEAALGAPAAEDTLRSVLEEAYDLLEREQKLIAFMDRCAREVPALERAFLRGARRRFFADFAACLQELALAGHVRGDIDIAAAARATLEMLVWMAMRRRGDPEPPACDETAARDAAIAVAASGLAARPGPSATAQRRT